jgi:hypothetical protein
MWPTWKKGNQSHSTDWKRKPAAAPMAIVTKNPYVAAAKFVISRRDLPKNVRQTAQTIADQIIRRAARGT